MLICLVMLHAPLQENANWKQEGPWSSISNTFTPTVIHSTCMQGWSQDPETHPAEWDPDTQFFFLCSTIFSKRKGLLFCFHGQQLCHFGPVSSLSQNFSCLQVVAVIKPSTNLQPDTVCESLVNKKEQRSRKSVHASLRRALHFF